MATNNAINKSNINFFTSINVQGFTSSGTYTPTPGMQYCIIECVGGGGAGGGTPTSAVGQSVVGSGGGGGNYITAVFTAATIGASQTITIGSGGTGVAGSNGGNGSTSSVGTLITSPGGAGGLAGASSSNSSCVFGGAGGGDGTATGIVGQARNNSGEGGQNGITSMATNGNLALPGRGGRSAVNPGAYAGGFAALSAASVAGAPAFLGGGGSGSVTNNQVGSARPGGNGGVGIVIITEFIA